jgi:pimeloyl-ACP methyl ester carboxylesterase
MFRDALLHYTVTGSGNTVMLVHGFGEDRSIWDGLAEKLSRHYRLIIPDLPGSGESTMLTGDDIGISDYAESLLAILQFEDVKKLTMIGHSMGGYITLAFAEQHPGLLNAFGLFHSSAYADDAEKIATRKKAIEFIQQNGSVPFLKTSIPGMFADPEKSEAEISHLVSRAANFKPEELIQYYRAMIERPDRTEVLQTFSGPIMFMLGTQDKAVRLEAGLKQSHLPSISHIHILESGHMGMLEQPENSLLKMMHFLSSVYVC